jgi:hypothetical protein
MPGTVDLDQLLARKHSLATRASETRDLPARLRDLRAWQSRRLARTYDDLRRDSRYSRGIEFFLSDLYAPLDFGVRDRQLTRASRLLKRGLPGAALAPLERAIELDVLSAELDHAMVALMPGWPIDGAGYATAYRAVGRRDARERQIELIVSIGADLDAVVGYAWIGAALNVWRVPARLGGFGVLHDFLVRGFDAFRNIEDIQTFLKTIREREAKLMERLFAGGGEELFARRAQQTGEEEIEPPG